MEDIKIKVEIEVSITQEDIDDIMSTALEGGINYWCKKVEVDGDYLGEYASEQISRGGNLKLYDSEDDKVYKLTREKLVEGVRKYLADSNKPYNILDENSIDCCMVDAEVADMIIQYAVFGYVIYG